MSNKIKMIDIVGELLKVFLLYFCTIFEKECYNHIFQNIDKIDVLKKKTKRNVIKHFFPLRFLTRNYIKLGQTLS